MSIVEKVARKPRNNKQISLFDVEEDWRDVWWGMPEFEMKDARPQYKITINFMTAEDVVNFANTTGLSVTTRSTSAWFPSQERMNEEFHYVGPKTDSKYPICIPSKGRWDCQRTGKALDRLGVSYRFFVEETEADLYMKELGEDKVVVMPFHDLGQGSIPARNFIWEWAKEREYKRHWVVDDNIQDFVRCNLNRRISVHGGGYFRAMEDFVDRYENIVMAGPHERGFVDDRSARLKPYILNHRVYSCILLDTSLPHRWRGRYNEDTDLSIRLLKDGYCTLLFTALLMHKFPTVGSKNSKPLKGGNTDNVYNTDDHRFAFAESLREQHPDIVKVVWRFNRWHHYVDYSAFKNNKPILKSGVVPVVGNNEYNMTLAYRK